MSESDPIHKIRPDRQRWTHLALHVSDIDASIAWYEKHTHLQLLARNQDEFGRGAWLGDSEEASSPFILVLAQFDEGKDPFAPAKHAILTPFAHIGIEVPTRGMVDELASKAKEADCLALGPRQMPDPVGYVCFIRDPDGNLVEFSYDQGVYERALEVWGDQNE
ncbi:MAG: VOC family protein [Woeseia sp.]